MAAIMARRLKYQGVTRQTMEAEGSEAGESMCGDQSARINATQPTFCMGKNGAGLQPLRAFHRMKQVYLIRVTNHPQKP
jgi:hypothetical protein